MSAMEGAGAAGTRRGCDVRFLADAMLGRLATWLRVLGYDAEYDRREDAVLVERARREHRILLTRDTRLLRRRDLPGHLFIRSDRVRDQLRELLVALDLPVRGGGRRCLRCNVALEARAREAVRGRVPDFVWASQQVFWGCPRCGRIYWAGTHRQRMDEAIRALSAALRPGSGAGARMRIVFMGSPPFAVPSLEQLLAEGHQVPLVVSQPDREAGRGRALRAPAVKAAALARGLPTMQPEKLTDAGAMAALAEARPDVIVVVAFGQFVPRAIRELPPLGCVNVHASLLPRYRGAAPIAWAIMAGERETGVSLMRVEARMDAGPVLLQRACAIGLEEDAGSLEGRLAHLGADVLGEGLRRMAEGRAVWTPQDERLATVAPKIRDEDCRLALAGDAVALVNRVRGLCPAPGAYVLLADGRRLKVMRAAARRERGPAGHVLAVERDALVVGTGSASLALLEVQPEGKRSMGGGEFARGRRLRPGERLSEQRGVRDAAGGERQEARAGEGGGADGQA
jgi:methionyl-tRNA formyltransferase